MGVRAFVAQAKVHAIQTGTVRIRPSQMAGVGVSGVSRLLHILSDSTWSDWVPIYAWLVEHDEGLIRVDTGETARVHEPGYHPRWHPFFRRASSFHVTPDDELGPALRRFGASLSDVKHVVLTHMHTDHAGGLGHVAGRKVWVHGSEWKRARGIGGQIQGYLPHRWPKWTEFVPLGFESRRFGPFTEAMPLSTRGDVLVVPTPGHTLGHVSVMVDRGDVVIALAGDTSYTEALLCAGVVDGVSPDAEVAKRTQAALRALARERPVVYLPSHDPESGGRLARLQVMAPPEESSLRR